MHELMSKEEAFEKIDNLKFIKTNSSQHDFRFTRNWFRARNQSTWSTFFPRGFDGSKPVNMVQIGVFEGADLIWCLQNILTHKDSRVIAIDPWLKTNKLSQDVMNECYDNAVHNLSPWSNKVKIVRDSSHVILPNLRRPMDLYGINLGVGDYDLIVIDGDHVSGAVLKDAIDSLKLVKPDGWLVFDDYYNKYDKEDHVEEGVRLFLDVWGEQVELVWQHRFSLCFKKLEAV